MHIGYGKSNFENSIKIGTKFEYYFHNIMSRITGKQGCFSYFATKRFLRKVSLIKPDIIHLHNIHGNYINYKLLFNYIKKYDIPVVWTFHDCWPFTGKCVHYNYVKCNKWKNKCFDCQILHEYPKCFFDCSKSQFQIKKEIFSNINNLSIVTPSIWLANEVKKSFFAKNNIYVINNGIDLKSFYSYDVINTIDEFKNKYILLGVANNWNYKKGLYSFIELSKNLDNRYLIVLVGFEKKQMNDLPSNIFVINKTNNIKELRKIYNLSNIYINLTYEDNFPTTNMEALACGIPVITNDVGGAKEIIDCKTGTIINNNNIEQLILEIERIKERKIKKEICCERAKLFDKNNKFKEYEKLYDKILMGAT